MNEQPGGKEKKKTVKFGKTRIPQDEYSFLVDYLKVIDNIIIEVIDSDFTVAFELDLSDKIDGVIQYKNFEILKLSSPVLRKLLQELIKNLSELLALLDPTRFRVSKNCKVIPSLQSREDGEWVREVLRPESMKIRYSLRDLFRELHPEEYRDVPPFEDSYETYLKNTDD
jgi:hypothetical protein